MFTMPTNEELELMTVDQIKNKIEESRTASAKMREDYFKLSNDQKTLINVLKSKQSD